MEDYNGYETVKEKLILTGISELQTHTIEDLSLRKISTLCNVSCATPYKHFKNKQDFIDEIIMYINYQWTRLRSQIVEAFARDEEQQMIEVCIGYIKFCMANPNFRNIMVMKRNDRDGIEPRTDFYLEEEDNLIRRYCTRRFPDPETAEKKTYTIHSIVYGSTYMMDREHVENSGETIDMVRRILEDEVR